MNQQTMTVWAAINKDGNLSMHLKEPYRDGNIWISEYPYCNSLVYDNIFKLYEKTQYNWTNDPQVFVIKT